MTEKRTRRNDETTKEAVTITKLEDVGKIDDLSAWPSGNVFVQALRQLAEECTEVTTTGSMSHNNTQFHHHHQQQQQDPDYWQACARWALLRKYGYLAKYDNDDFDDMETALRRSDFFDMVTTEWRSAIVCASRQDEDSLSSCNEKKNDLLDFFQQRGKSRNRNLKFHLMHCAPGCQFNLHAHPNLELVYCVRGALHEIRMQGPALPNEYNPHPTKPDTLKGPNLTILQRPWKFGTLRQGTWLVNEAGSVHKSFTATSGDGCILITLWSGSHADILETEVPNEPNVKQAVATMDRKLDAATLSLCTCTKDWKRLEETFLPASERWDFVAR